MRRPNLLIIGAICLFIILDIIFLRPTSVEQVEENSQGMFENIENMVSSQKPSDEVGYTIDNFRYTSVEGENKQWEMIASHALLYEKSRQVKASVAHIKMYDAQGKITLIEGDVAYYNMAQRDFDLEKNVKVTFPDGFWIKTNKAHYNAKLGLVTSEEDFYGEALPDKNEIMQLWGTGFSAEKSGPNVYIKQNSKVRHRRLASDEASVVHSDKARLDRFSKVAFFNMDAPDRFVESEQGSMRIRSRRQQATYDSVTSQLKYMTAFEDVLIKETDPVKTKNGLKYATCQRADFLTKENKVLLSGFPSAYQANDTLTGELIVIYRNRNVVEVTHANAFYDSQILKEDSAKK